MTQSWDLVNFCGCHWAFPELKSAKIWDIVSGGYFSTLSATTFFLSPSSRLEGRGKPYRVRAGKDKRRRVRERESQASRLVASRFHIFINTTLILYQQSADTAAQVGQIEWKFRISSLSLGPVSPCLTPHRTRRERETMDVGTEQKKVIFVKFQYL